MASVRSHGKRLLVRLYAKGRERTAVVNRAWTKANVDALLVQARKCEERLENGEEWELLRDELKGIFDGTAAPKTLGWYFQFVLDMSEVEDGTLIHYQKTYNRIWFVFDKRDITSITKAQLQRRMSTVCKHYTVKAKKNALSVLRQAFHVAYDDNIGLDSDFPTDNWRFPKHGKPKKQPYTPEERDALLEQLKGQHETAWRFFTLGFFTGMRTEELLAISRRQLMKPRILVDQRRTSNKLIQGTKTHNDRKVFVPDQIWKSVVEPWRFQEWLFVGEKGRPFTQANKMTQQFQIAHDATEIPRRLNRAGNPTPYPWRHTYASIALMRGTNPGLVANQMGDLLATVLKDYAEFIPRDDDTEALENAV